MKSYILSLIKKYRELSPIKKVSIVAAIIGVMVILWAFLSAVIITGNFNRSQVNASKDDKKLNAAGLIITETKDGKKYFEIYGEFGRYSNEDNIAILQNVVGNFYKNGEIYMSFQSSKGSYDEKHGVITLYENTYIVLKDETSLEANKLTWSGTDNVTVAEGNVKIKKGNDMIALADRCDISPGYEKFKIIGKTQTKIYSSKEIR